MSSQTQLDQFFTPKVLEVTSKIITENSRRELEFEPKYDTDMTTKYVEFILDQINQIKNDFSVTHLYKTILAFLEVRWDDQKELMSDLDDIEREVYDRVLMNLIFFFMHGYYDDILGRIRMLLLGAKEAQRTGQYYTPFDIALLSAKMIQPDSSMSMHEPTIGSGVMPLAVKYLIHKQEGWKKAAQYNSNIYGQDLSEVGILMCKIQLILTNYPYVLSLLRLFKSQITDVGYLYRIYHIEAQFGDVFIADEVLTKLKEAN